MAIESTMEELYPIRTVASLTGVNPITLRAWERRYGLIEPMRTDSGHRLYSQKNIEVINRAVELQSQGISIGRIAQLFRHHLVYNGKFSSITEKTWASYCQEMLAAVAHFSEDRLDLIYENALKSHSIQEVILKLIVPMLEEIGQRWKNDDISVAEEHFFAVYLRNKLGALFHRRMRLTRGRKLLVACMPGELHEVGMLLFALAAHDAGFRPVMLGTNMPLSGLPFAVERSGCSAIILSARCEPPSGVVDQDLAVLVNNVTVPVFVGGNASVRLSTALERIEIVSLGSDINAGLQRLVDCIGPPGNSLHIQ